jgi:hypothetical protein
MFNQLPQLLDHIQKSGLFNPYSLSFCAKFTRNLKLYYNLDKDKGFFVKVCLNIGAKREYQALKFAYSKIDSHVPEPLLFLETQSLSAYVSPLYRFKVLSYNDFFLNPFLSQVCEILCLGLTFSNDYSHSLIRSDSIQLEHLKSFAINEKIIDKENNHCLFYIDRCYSQLSLMNQIPQHCDVTPYNFSVERKTVFLCDWEDFGMVCFPGFDLATFISEIAQKAGLQIELANSPDVLNNPILRKITDNVLPSQDLKLKQWQVFFPFYILLFSYLKKKLGYSIEYFHTLCEFLNTIFHARKWQKCFKDGAIE